MMNSECNGLPEPNVVVQRWLNAHDVDQLPTLVMENTDETLVKEIESDENIKNFNDFLPTLEGSGNSDASGFSDATELDHGDPEILVTRVKTAPPTNSISGENSECDREYFCIKMFENLEKQIQILKNKDMANELEKLNQNKILLEIQNQNKNNAESIRETITTVCNNNLQQVVAQVGGSLEKAIILAQNDLKSNINEIRTEVTEIKGNVQDNFTQFENKIQSDLAQAEVNNKKQLDKLSCQSQGLATEVIAAVTNLDGKIQFVGQELSTVREEVGFLSERIKRYEGDTNNELVHMRDRIDFIEKELEESRIEVQAHTSGSGILLSGLEKQVSTLKKTIEEVESLYQKCQQGINNLEERVEAGAIQGNVLNNHLHEIDSKLDRANELPERMEHTLVQLLKNYKKEIDTNNYSKYPIHQECPTQPMSTNELVTPILHVPNNIPSIPSSPLLNNSFSTPPFLINQPIPELLGAVSKKRNMRSDQVIADIVKREQKPCFNGDNISPPIFLQEVERFFELIQITDDRDRLQLFPTFLITNPFEWWKLISYQVTTWDMAKDLFLRQYFNDYERQRYKAEWHSLECENFSNVEEFTLRGLKILNTIKAKDSEQKKCERITVKLPEPLRDYLLNKQFQSTQHFLSCIKEAMLLKKFSPNLYFRKQKSNSNASTGGGNTVNQPNNSNSNNGNTHNNRNNYNNRNNDYNNNSNNGNNHNRNNNYNNRNNDYNNNNNINNNNSNIPNMNPHFRGNPKNYIPNFKPPSYGNGGSSSNSNSGYRSPPKSPPRGQNRNYSNNKSNGQGNQNGRNSTYYRNSGFGNNRSYNNGNTGTSGATTPRPGVNQVRWAATPPTPGSPGRTSPPTTTNQAPTSPPVTHLHFTFPTHLLKTDGTDMLSPQASPTNHFTMKSNFIEEMDEQTEN